MAGSAGHPFRRHSPEEVREWIAEIRTETETVEYESQVNGVLSQLLIQYNDRDVNLMRRRLDEIEGTIEDTLDTSVDLRFGGSIAKHTYIDGLSDVDALAVLRDPGLGSLPAQEVLNAFAEILDRGLSYEVRVSEGNIAVTIQYPDGMEIQILPAVQSNRGLRIPSASGTEWSQVIRPRDFADKLTERNKACAGNLIPVIKLAKAALMEIPGPIKPTGYHIESLAVEAFRRYGGATNHKAMLHHLFRRGSELVLSPIKDSTGQSLNVDQDLGPARSRERRTLQGVMDRIARRMANADRSGSPDEWLASIGEQP